MNQEYFHNSNNILDTLIQEKSRLQNKNPNLPSRKYNRTRKSSRKKKLVRSSLTYLKINYYLVLEKLFIKSFSLPHKNFHLKNIFINYMLDVQSDQYLPWNEVKDIACKCFVYMLYIFGNKGFMIEPKKKLQIQKILFAKGTKN